jgi:hypothetical protein
MNGKGFRVDHAEDGQWIVHCPGGDKHPFPNKGQAEAVAHASHVFFSGKARPGEIRSALVRLEENGLQLELGRKLRSKLKAADKEEHSR